ncbi:hypothetical protein QWY87_02960 [Lutimonas halocynthiae]|uniref:glucosamine inositolphosphorylceramide transferase family protein n=1 Tax=Lutimonas halocynthiae TaxID=1446477 RepID=UPI0025B503D0|nr:hypothetical protein [Lutimonas halocynthiae]MDN3641645.1 hypothetical protein [Lutimonas halocynthiae]
MNNSNYSKVVLIVRKDYIDEQKPTFFSKLNKLRKQFVLIIYSKFESIFYRFKRDAMELKNLSDINNCSSISIRLKKSEYTDFFNEKDSNRIMPYDLDILLNLSQNDSRGEIVKSAKYGVWTLCFGTQGVYGSGLIGVWEVIKNKDVSIVYLKLNRDTKDRELLLFKSFSSTDSKSFRKNANNILWKTKNIIPRKIQELYIKGGKEFFQRVHKNNKLPIFVFDKNPNSPSNIQMLKFIISKYSMYLIGKIRLKLYFKQWILLVKFNETNLISNSFFNFKRLIPPKDRFWADPFILERQNSYFIFFEELIYSEDKGKISVIEMNSNGIVKEPVVVLERNYHLSYPFLIEYCEELYMIPETAENNSIEIYKCIDFPVSWKLQKVLFKNIKAVDTTVFRHDNVYWLFTNIKEDSGASQHDELFLFYSDKLLTENWVPHPMNPIVSDVRFARPAGNIFCFEDRIFRPSQNCAKHYGHGIEVREVIELTKTSYSEKNAQSIYPNWNDDLTSTHTLNWSNKLTVIDAMIIRRKTMF